MAVAPVPSDDALAVFEARRNLIASRARRAFATLSVAVPIGLASFGLAVALPKYERLVLGTGVGFATLLSLVALILALRSLGRPVHLASVVTILLSLPLMFFGAILTILLTGNFTRGRQLRSNGRVLLPPLADGASWTTQTLEASAPDALRVPLARAWRDNGRTEHASVGAFARLTLDLLSLGAPPRLIQDAQKDTLDEIRHAELCFSLAQSFDGYAESPGPFPAAGKARTLSGLRRVALVQLAIDSLIDGALHEGLSARVLAKLAPRCGVPAVRSLLQSLAADEGRHAAHGWDVVQWCLHEGGAPVAHALEGALLALRTELNGPRPSGAEEGAWEIYGIHGSALEQTEYARMRAEVIRITHALLQRPLREVAGRA